MSESYRYLLGPIHNYAGKIWKRSFISTVRPTVHTNPSQKQSRFRKRSSNRRNLKTPALRFRMGGKYFENGAFRKRWSNDNHMISLSEFSSNTIVVLLSFQISPASSGRKIFDVFKVKTSFSNCSSVVWMGPYIVRRPATIRYAWHFPAYLKK